MISFCNTGSRHKLNLRWRAADQWWPAIRPAGTTLATSTLIRQSAYGLRHTPEKQRQAQNNEVYMGGRLSALPMLIRSLYAYTKHSSGLTNRRWVSTWSGETATVFVASDGSSVL